MLEQDIYKLVAATDVHTFDRLMNEALQDGYDIEGQLVVTPIDGGMQYSQAMLKIEDYES